MKHAIAIRAGFTLIELMIAIGLGVVLVYTSFAGFRMASQCVTVANRLSTENSLVRAGFQMAHEDLDFWTTYDDPLDVNAQPLRQHGPTPWGMEEGLPFTPMANTDVGGHGGLGDAAQDDSDRGWDSKYRWPVSDPRAWWRGNSGEQDTTHIPYGRYAIFSANTANLNVTSGSFGTYGSVTVPNTWFPNQLQTLWYGLGYYGLLEYMPANTIYTWYQEYGPGCEDGGVPLELLSPSSSFTNPDGAVGYPRGNYLLTFGTSFAVPSPSDAADYVNLHWRARHFFNTNYFSTKAAMQTFEQATTNVRPLMSQLPEHWPGVEVRVGRFLKDARYVAVCRVRWKHTETGAIKELSFSGFGSTLRGARQQRGKPTAANPAGGWAAWDNAAAAVNDPTLDDY